MAALLVQTVGKSRRMKDDASGPVVLWGFGGGLPLITASTRLLHDGLGIGEL
jgi:hypothetical protein